MSSFSLKKEERLSSRKIIGSLFSEGNSFFVYPLKVVFRKMALPGTQHVLVAFSVSKRNFKRAVVRNLLKRRMREAYRLNKEGLFHSFDNQEYLAVMFIYTAREIKEYCIIEKSMKQALSRLASAHG